MSKRNVVKLPTDAEIDTIARRSEELASRQYAKDFRYDRRAKMLRFVMRSGAELAVPVSDVSSLKDVAPDDLAKLELYPTGSTISLSPLDIDVSVPGILRKTLGFDLAQKRAGSVKSAAKAASSRANGAKGGRPRKAPVKA